MIRRHELKLIVPFADSTIFEMERRREFPRRFNLTPRCVVWDLEEVEAWIAERRQSSLEGRAKVTPAPKIRQRRTAPVKPTT
jgi:predicted DNA-binding transcriptional regulator AlpA